MSLVLLGWTGDGRTSLAPLATGLVPPTMADSLAAFYLARLGDPSGWSIIRRDLAGGDGFTRLMAARHLVGFLPYDGQAMGDEKVDVVGLLADRLSDDDRYLAVEVPALLAEIGNEHAIAVLRRTVKDATYDELRDAAARALDARSS